MVVKKSLIFLVNAMTNSLTVLITVLFSVPDSDGGVLQDLPVAGPAAVGGAIGALRGGGADGSEAALLGNVTEVLQGNHFMRLRLEVKLSHAVDLNK